MTKWFIQQSDEGNDLGPFQPCELLEMVRNGEVTCDTMLRNDECGWFAAADIGGLFEAAMRPTIQYLCPHCETEICEPPVQCHRCGRQITEAVMQITENSIVNRADQP